MNLILAETFVGLRDRCQPPLQPKKAPLSRDVHSKVESERPAHAHGQPRGNRFDSNIPIAAITDPPLPIFSASAISPPPPPPSSPLLPADASPDQELPADERASEPRGRMGYIGAHGVETLKRYRYSGQDHSVVAKYVLQPFWSRCVTLFPLWMPPNMITLTGFMFLVVSALLGYIYSPHLDTAPPRWVHLAHGLLLFLYQTFDAVDGKQARRTSSSSPLGELFDHGCDALACAFEALALGSTLMCGRFTFCFWVIAAVPFYLATWEHFFTNTLILPLINGPTEGLMLIYLSHSFTFLTGAEWWAQDFRKSIPLLSWVPLPFIPDIPLYIIVMILMILFAVIPTIGSNVSNVQKVVEARKGSMVLALAMLLPFIALLTGVAVWSYLSPSDIMRNQPHLLVIGTGFAFGYLVGRMILAHLCDEPIGLKTGMCMSLVFLPFAIANALTAKINAGIPLVDELLVLFLYCAYTVGLYLHLAVSVVHEIKDALGIYCFRITRKEA
uniref:Aminoalcoholphosphotransferase n=1 Tax=Oryza glumipatula TaxID=40148 RepID=A0A0E0A6G6_9ORYZ